MDPTWLRRLEDLPPGYSRGHYRGRTYGLTRTVFNGGESQKLYAEELGGTDFVSLNVYRTSSGVRLRPCEMPADKVIDFLTQVRPAPR